MKNKQGHDFTTKDLLRAKSKLDAEPKKDLYIKKIKPITIKVKKFYGEEWLSVIDLHGTYIKLDKRHKTKKEAEKDYPTWVCDKNKKIVKVWLVEAL